MKIEWIFTFFWVNGCCVLLTASINSRLQANKLECEPNGTKRKVSMTDERLKEEKIEWQRKETRVESKVLYVCVENNIQIWEMCTFNAHRVPVCARDDSSNGSRYFHGNGMRMVGSLALTATCANSSYSFLNVKTKHSVICDSVWNLFVLQ